MLRSIGNVVVGALLAIAFFPAAAAGDPEPIEDTIARVKQSVVGIGTFQRTRSPAFQFRATGFAVADGSFVATNAHALPDRLDTAGQEHLAVLLPGTQGQGRVAIRRAAVVTRDASHDLAVLKIEGSALVPLELGDSSQVREGRSVYLTGFPIGAVLGPYPVTHRGLVASITPIAIPQANAQRLNATVLRRLSEGTFPVFQLDATAYPGNSGSPVYDVGGRVIGIVNMVLVKATKESLLSQPSGITYAVPVSHLRELLSSVR